MALFWQLFAAFFTHPRSRAVGLVFAADGFFYGSWSALIPYVKYKFGLDDAQLGLLLFCLPLGVTLANPLAALLIRRFGMRRTTLYTLFITAFCFWLPMLAPSVYWLAPTLFVCGAFFSVLNVAMNTCASSLETAEGMRILSTCHGMWSLGAMSGSALSGTLTGLGMSPVLYMGLAMGLAMLVGLVVWRNILQVPDLPAGDGQTGAAFSWPTAALWGLVTLSLCTNLSEGTMADWAAVYLRDVVRAAPWVTGYGFAAYAFWMAAGRFAGDALLTRYGPREVLRVGGATVAAGLGLAVFLPATPTVLAGFALVGAGVSLGAPILYGAAARAPGMAPGAGLATMNTFAMTGFLAGPTMIGLIAKASSLPVAFLLVAGMALFWSWKAGSARGLSD